MGTRSDLSGGISLRFTAAGERAHELAARPYGSGRPAPLPHPMRRVRVVGDPQTSLERFLAVLDAHDLLGVDGFLADDVQLVSTGDELDEDGFEILRWLAEHAPAQVVLLLGDHDWSALGERERRLVGTLLRAGRYRLAAAGVLADDRPVLLSHAGLTAREVEQLDVPVEPRALAAALDRRLAEAVRVGRADAPVDLGPFQPAAARPLAPHDLPTGLLQACSHGTHAVSPAPLSPWLLDVGVDTPDLDPDHVPLLELASL